MHTGPLSVYVHIPFCDVKCSYCAFNIIVGRDDLIPRFTEALLREIEQVSQPQYASHTLYFGGGTPSKLPPEHIHRLIAAARTHLNLQPKAEVTLEANPSRADVSRFEGYRAAGVNRLSLGVQSLHPAQLELYRRTHTLQQAQNAFQAAREAGFDNISLDLIFGAPHQTRMMWQHTLREAVAWGPEHFSLYGLILEPQTKLTHAIARGDLPTPDDELTATMYHDARYMLLAAGYTQYEIASFARPGYESAHNQQYWRNRPYLGLGPGAHGYMHPYRYWVMRSVPRYINTLLTTGPGDYPFSAGYAGHELITKPTAMAETMMLGLRMVQEGLSRQAFAARFGRSLEAVYGPQIAQLKAKSLLIERAGRLLLTEQAYLISNQVFAEFMLPMS